jgi:hypothetical protein
MAFRFERPAHFAFTPGQLMDVTLVNLGHGRKGQRENVLIDRTRSFPFES